MASTFAWLDTSERDRRRALDIIDAFRERETREELGLGSIRDGLADRLFPGTSTVQTRARYFLFVPWIYVDLEQRHVPSGRIAAAARAMEINLIAPLAVEGAHGVIGIDARASLKRLPSSIYWQGLGSWGIRTFPGSQSQYHRSLDAHHRRAARTSRGDDAQLDARAPVNWHRGLPPVPDAFPERASMVLTPHERAYLRERIMLAHPRSLLAHLTHVEPWDTTPFAWLHPEFSQLPARHQHELHHARCFSEMVHGAQLLYNLMLAELTRRDDLVDDYRLRLERWSAETDARWAALSGWARTELPAFWSLLDHARVRVPTRAFVERWAARVLAVGAGGVADDVQARRLVHDREVQLKKSLSRLENATARAAWGGAAGARRLDLRWGITQELLRDILSPGAVPDA